MRCRRAPVRLWAHGSALRLQFVAFPSIRTHSVGNEPRDPSPRDKTEAMKERATIALQTAGQLGRQWGQRSVQTASVTMNYWWERYEDFVGLNEVREAQTKVTEAESAFMVSRGMVSDAHSSLEALQLRLKEVRARLDRVSREEAHYLELATLEHKLLQEERRLRTAYENAESSEREKFALFSAAVWASHEKERTRAERTKNWSIIGSVLGALIGVMGSTYINRVRLQELKALLLEAQKGPENLQEALKVQAGNHRSQQEELRSLIDSLRIAVSTPAGEAPDVPLGVLTELRANSRQTTSELQTFKEQLEQLQRGVGGVQGQLGTVTKLLEATPPEERTLAEDSLFPETPAGCHLTGTETVVRHLEETQRILGERMRTNTLYNAVFTYSASAIAVCAVYALLRGAA